MASVRFYERGINKDSKPPVMCVTGVDPRAEFFFANTPADHFFSAEVRLEEFSADNRLTFIISEYFC